MSLVKPAYAGGESIVGLAREAVWGTTPTSVDADPNKAFGSVAAPAVFMPMKEETFDPMVNADPQMDDMDENREISRIIANGNTIEGGVRLNAGPESIGYFLTMMFGTPTTTTLAATSGAFEAAYQHIWTPGLNTRGNWPASYSFESRIGAVKSKLVMGALIKSLPIDIPNNGAMVINPTFIAKAMQMLGGADTSATLDDEGVALPCILTADPTMIDETEWHWKLMKAYPQIDGANEQSVTSFAPQFEFPDLRGLFTGGSGQNIGTYALDKFQASGRATILFEDETIWYKVKQGSYFKLDVTLEGATIQGAYKNSLQIIQYSCQAPKSGVENKVGDLQYDLAFTCRKDPTEGKSCQITLINTVSSYA